MQIEKLKRTSIHYFNDNKKNSWFLWGQIDSYDFETTNHIKLQNDPPKYKWNEDEIHVPAYFAESWELNGLRSSQADMMAELFS